MMELFTRIPNLVLSQNRVLHLDRFYPEQGSLASIDLKPDCKIKFMQNEIVFVEPVPGCSIVV